MNIDNSPNKSRIGPEDVYGSMRSKALPYREENIQAGDSAGNPFGKSAPDKAVDDLRLNGERFPATETSASRDLVRQKHEAYSGSKKMPLVLAFRENKSGTLSCRIKGFSFHVHRVRGKVIRQNDGLSRGNDVWKCIVKKDNRYLLQGIAVQTDDKPWSKEKAQRACINAALLKKWFSGKALAWGLSEIMSVSVVLPTDKIKPKMPKGQILLAPFHGFWAWDKTPVRETLPEPKGSHWTARVNMTPPEKEEITGDPVRRKPIKVVLTPVVDRPYDNRDGDSIVVPPKPLKPYSGPKLGGVVKSDGKFYDKEPELPISMYTKALAVNIKK